MHVFNMHLRKKIVMLMASLVFIFVVFHIHWSIVNYYPYSIYKQKYYLDGLSHWYNYSGELSLFIVFYILCILL
jgi:hypothetical protein